MTGVIESAKRMQQMKDLMGMYKEAQDERLLAGLVEKAREFALQRHGDQDHGCLKIASHLDDVAKNVSQHYDPEWTNKSFAEIMAAAWLHDVVEDTQTTLTEIADQFGVGVQDIVFRVTDKAGANRKERHLKTYWRIRQDPAAVLVKLCDRRHNQARSIEFGERWVTMYEREFDYFAFALWQPHQYETLWEELFEQKAQMKKLLEW